MDDYINKETKQFLGLFLAFALFMFFIYPNSFGNLNNKDIYSPFTKLLPSIGNNNNKLTLNQPPTTTLTKNKDYKAKVSTNLGQFEIDFFENGAPKNVANIQYLSAQYQNTPVLVDKNYLIKIQTSLSVGYNIQDEINANYLLLDRTKVKEASYLKEAYDPNDKSTKPFSPDNLRKYEDFTLKEFYEDVLGYKYDASLVTPKAYKYTVYAASTGPGQNNGNFFILLTVAPEIDGRYTPIGRVTSGLDILDQINRSSNVVVNSVTFE
jgi:cyclophilin family peptidyl-prolyl cis-trans isomerase